MNLVKDHPVVLLIALPLGYIVRHPLPFSWHLRILLPYFIKRWKSYSLQSLPGGTLGQPCLRLNEIPIGKDPFQDDTSYSFIATIDDCDFLGHLSNSSYPKKLDISRSHYAASALFQFQADGGWVPLASISFNFIKEITIFTRYEIRSKFYAWDEKWFYLTNEFISKDKKGSQVLHCVSISKHCFKLGRKTIPPWFVLVNQGYSPASSSDRLNNWKKSQALRLRLQKSNKQSNPITAFQPGDNKQDWMKSDFWDVGDWQQECTVKLQKLHQFY